LFPFHGGSPKKSTVCSPLPTIDLIAPLVSIRVSLQFS
jgi:hypothetical protein